MKIIGLCGGSGAGKTVAAAAIHALGGAVVDTDLVYRELCVAGSACLSEIADAFGEGALTESGELNRPEVAKIIYGSAEKRAELNAITHKYIKADTARLIAEHKIAGKTAVIVDAPLLFESGFDRMCDCTVGVVAELEARVARIVTRDGLDDATARRRIASQDSDETLYKKCDYIIENNGSLPELFEKASALYVKIIAGGDGV